MSGEPPLAVSTLRERAREARTERRRIDATTVAMLAAVGALVVLALSMRLVELGERAMHHDESLHALFAYRFAEGEGYRHDPLMHGPLQFHLLAAFFKLFGASEFVARLPAALAGTALVATPLLLRRWLGAVGVVTASLLLAISPALLYYSRFARNDLFIAVFTILLVTAVWRYRADGRFRWLVLAAALLTLQFATKETAYLTSAMLLLYVNAALTTVILDRRGVMGRSRWEQGGPLFLVAWLAALAWPLVAERYELGKRPREADLLVVLGTVVVPFLGAAIQLPITALGGSVDGDTERVLGGATAGALVVAAASVGLWWDWRRWLVIGAVSYAITVPLFTTWFTNPAGIAGPFWNQLDYWLAQQDVQRGTQPWFYYLFLVPLYELLALVPALIGGAWLLWRGNRLARLLAWWFIGTLVALSYAGEKMPWLVVHLALPLALLAALALGQALPALARRAFEGRLAPTSWGAATAGSVAIALLLALALRTGAAVAFTHPDTPVEPLIYTQTSPDVPRLSREIDAIAAARGGKDRLPVWVETAQSLSWPWAWYLRDYPQASYVATESITGGDLPAGAVLIATEQTINSHPELRDAFAVTQPYRHRWWFPEGGYRSITPRGLLEGLRDGSLVSDWIEFYADRVSADRLGALEGEVLLPEAPPDGAVALGRR